MISDSKWIAPKDYKVYCFNGKPSYVMVCVGREKKGHPLFFYYDRNWNKLPFSQDAIDYPDYIVDRPKCLDYLFSCAEILSKPFEFVRADFYVVDDKVYFGELTFTPSAGMDSGRMQSTDLLFGSMTKLPI